MGTNRHQAVASWKEEAIKELNGIGTDLIKFIIAALVQWVFSQIVTDNELLERLPPDQREEILLIRQEVYQAVVRRGIAALQDG